jgi:hypothetical protein
MSAEPFVLYSHAIDPQGVLRVLRELAPSLEFFGPIDNWETITISGPKRLLRKSSTLSFRQDPAYYAGPGWAAQMSGMQGYFSQFPENENSARVMLLINSFRFALSMFPAPSPELDLESDDPRLSYVFAVAKYLDAAIFTPSALRDAAGRILLGAGEADPRAVMPAIYKSAPAATRSERTRSEHGTILDSDDTLPPSPERVARRALALAAVAGRALLEHEDPSDTGVEETRTSILAWVEGAGFGDELEPDEWQVLQLPLGAIPEQDAVNACWRLEGLGVLAWALNRFGALPHDRVVVPAELLTSMGILDVEAARSLLNNPKLRSAMRLPSAASQRSRFIGG